MRIVLFSHNYAPEPIATGKVSGEMGAWLAERGHEVVAVAAPPFYPEWRVREDYRADPGREELIDGVRVLRVPLWVPADPTGPRRLLHLASLRRNARRRLTDLRAFSPDLVFSVQPTLAICDLALALARHSGAVAWHHIQDFEIDAALDLGLLRLPGVMAPVRGLARRWERRFLAGHDIVSTISPGMRRRLESRAAPSSKGGPVVRDFPNWVDTDEIRPLEAPSAYRSELGIPEGTRVLLYSGNLGAKQGLELVVEAAKALAHRSDLRFVIAGDGGEASRLRALAGDAPILWLPLQPRERLSEFLGLADVHLLPQREEAEDLVLPSKLTGQFASGRPVVATASSGTTLAEVVRGKGRVVPPGELESFVAALTALADDPTERRVAGEAARAHALREWTRDAILERFEASAREAVAARNRDPR